MATATSADVRDPEPPASSRRERATGGWLVPLFKVLAWVTLVGAMVSGVVLLVHASGVSCHYDEYFAQLCSNTTKGTLVALGIGLTAGSLLGFAVLWWMASVLDHVIAIRRGSRTA